MAYSLLYSLPGTPVIRSGEEIGMGDDLRLNERLSVRTPMQWDGSINSGFSTAKDTFRPVISMGDYRYQEVNVAKQLADSTALLPFIKKLVAIRKRAPEIGTADWRVLDVKADAVLAIAYAGKKGKLIAVHNFGAVASRFKLPVQGTFTDLLTGKTYNADQSEIQIVPYGYFWFREKISHR